MFELTYRLVVHCALYAVARLRVADVLAEGARSSDDIAAVVGADPDALYRLLRALSSEGVFTESAGRAFALTPLGETLRTDVAGSMHGWVSFSGSPAYLAAFAETLTAARTGRPGWESAHGVSFFEYFDRHPEEGAVFDDAMTGLSSWEADAVVAAYDFSSTVRLVDVGGGRGILLARILAANPHLEGVLFDQPATVAAPTPELDTSRCRIAAGDFFEGVPEGGDAYILKYIVHDWNDERAVTILRNCRNAMTANGRVLLVETVVPPPGEPHLATLQDVEMLVVLGSRERTEGEYAALLDEAGLRLRRVVPTAGHLSIVEARPSS